MTTRPHFRPSTPPREKYGPAMLIEHQAEADEYFEACVEHCMAVGIPREKAEEIERSNLAYYAGYYGNDIRARVEQLFRCAHPVFGPIATNGPPSPEAPFRAGLELGQKARGA